MSEILLSIDSFQIRQVNNLITELENLCKENNLSKEETKLTLLNMFKSAYPTYAYETADKMERARLVEKIYKNIDTLKTNLNSFLYKKEETESEAIADNLEAPPAQIELENKGETPAPETETKPLDNTQPNDNSSYLILPVRLLEALLKTAGNKKDNPHRMHLQSIGISTKNKMIFSTNGRIYLGLYDTEFSPDIDCQDKSLNPQLIMPDVLLYAEDVKIFLKSLKTLATEDKKVDKNLCLLKYTPPAPDEETPTLTLYSSNRALKKEVLAFNDDDTSFMTYKFIEVCLNVDYINEHIVDKNDAILDINYLTTLLDAYKKLTLNEYLDFSKFLHIEDKETDFEGKMYHDTDHSLIAGIACVRK